jgi:hypothetical protein
MLLDQTQQVPLAEHDDVVEYLSAKGAYKRDY